MSAGAVSQGSITMRLNRVACAARGRAAAGRGLARGAVVLCGALWLGGVGSLLAADPPEASASVEWGWWIYTSGTETYSDGNMVIGGPIGSAMLVCRQPGHTDWILVDGEALLMNKVGDLPERAVKTRGNYVRTRPWTGWGKETARDARELSFVLRDLYLRSRNSRPLIRHVPFLVGKGWPGDVGAFYDSQAKPLLAEMDLSVALDPNSPTKGRVTAQVPAAGTRAGYKAVVTLTLDDSNEPLAGELAPVGDEPNNAIDANSLGLQKVTLNLNFNDTVHPFCASLPQRDAFFKLFSATASVEYTVQQHYEANDPNYPSYRLLLAAYQRTPPNGPLTPLLCATCCVVAEWPELKFVASPGQEYFVVVEVQDTVANPTVLLDFTGVNLMVPAKGKKD